MEQLLADLRKLAARHRGSLNQDCQDLRLDLNIILDDASTPAYQYRNRPSWDTTWLDLEESQIVVVLTMGHIVERRLVLGDWETVVEVPA